MQKAFIEDYKGVVGFESIPKGDPRDLIENITKKTDIYESIRKVALRLDELGWTPENAGNISIREMPHHTYFFITASGSHFSNLKPEDITYIHNIEIVVGEIPLHIGANYGIYGELIPPRIVEALLEQGLLEQVKSDLGVSDFDYVRPRSKKAKSSIVQDGRKLAGELNIDKCKLYTYQLLDYIKGEIRKEGGSLPKGIIDDLIAEVENHKSEYTKDDFCVFPYTPDMIVDRFHVLYLAGKHELTEEQFVSFQAFAEKINLEQRCRKFTTQIEETGEFITYPITTGALCTEKYLKILTTKHNLTEEQIQSLRLARSYQSKGGYEILQEDFAEQNRKIINAGLDLKTLITYLGKRDLIKCKVYYTGAKDKEPSSETGLHGIFYARRWEYDNVNAIVHCHAPNITNNPPKGIPITETDQKIIGYGSLELAVEAMEALGEDMCVLLKGHGPIAVSDDWQRWIPTGKKGIFGHQHVLDESFEHIFEDAFKVLKKADKSVPRGMLSRMIGLFNH